MPTLSPYARYFPSPNAPITLSSSLFPSRNSCPRLRNPVYAVLSETLSPSLHAPPAKSCPPNNQSQASPYPAAPRPRTLSSKRANNIANTRPLRTSSLASQPPTSPSRASASAATPPSTRGSTSAGQASTSRPRPPLRPPTAPPRAGPQPT
jgi:hypothetical protein